MTARGRHPETGEDLMEIAQKLRKAAGLPDKVTGVVANDGNGSVMGKVKDALS